MGKASTRSRMGRLGKRHSHAGGAARKQGQFAPTPLSTAGLVFGTFFRMLLWGGTAAISAAAIASLASTTATTSRGRTAGEWRSRTVYQLLTDRFASEGDTTACRSELQLRHYCGGTFNGTAARLGYIRDMFDAIWISPVVTNTEAETIVGVPFHGYWAQDLYTINRHFGTADDLARLVQEAHAMDIWVMVDVAPNHMGPRSGRTPGTEAYVSVYRPFDRVTDYHPYCQIQNWGDQLQVEQCSIGRTLPLPDINTEDDSVVQRLNNWIANLVTTFGFDGIRIDTVKHIRYSFWSEFVRSAGVFAIGEIWNGDQRTVGAYQGVMDSAFNYPLYYPLRRAFIEGGSMRNLEEQIHRNRNAFRDTTVLGNFIDNHDNERLGHLSQDPVIVHNTLVYVLMADGIPFIYYGTEHGFDSARDPFNREPMFHTQYDQGAPLYQFMGKINRFRKYLKTVDGDFYTYLQWHLWVDDNYMAFRKSGVLVVVSNSGTNGRAAPVMRIANSGHPPGMVMRNVLDCSDTVVVNHEGTVQVRLRGNEPKIYYATSIGYICRD